MNRDRVRRAERLLEEEPDSRQHVAQQILERETDSRPLPNPGGGEDDRDVDAVDDQCADHRDDVGRDRDEVCAPAVRTWRSALPLLIAQSTSTRINRPTR